MPKKNGIANSNQNDDQNNQNVINEEEDNQNEIIEEAGSQGNQNQFPGVDLNESYDSYIPEEEFGHEVPKNYAGTILNEHYQEHERVYVARQRPANAGPAGPFEAEQPNFFGIFPSNGDYRHPRAYYKIMYEALKIFETAPIADADDKIAYCKYMAALELLSDGQAATIRRRFPVIGEEMEISMNLEEAWNLVHGRGQNGVRNLDRVKNIPLNGSTLGAIAAQKNTQVGCEQYITASTQYITARENQPFPGRELVLEQLPPKNAGNRVWRNPEEFASRLRERVPREQAMTPADIDQRLEQLTRRYRGRNGALNLDRMPEAERQEYTYLSRIKNWYSIYLGVTGNGVYVRNNPTVFQFRKNLNAHYHYIVLAQQTADPAFRDTMKQMDAFAQKAGMDISLAEIRQQGDELLQSRQVQRASGGLYGAIKAVGNGDLSKFEELIQLDDGYAQLLSLHHLVSVLQSEMDLEGKGYSPDTSFPQVFGGIQDDPDFLRVCEQHALDPLFRKAIHSVRDLHKKYSEANDVWGSALVTARTTEQRLNEITLQKTLAPVSAEQIKNLNTKMGSEGDVRKLAGAVSNNMRKQATLAKFLFLAQLGMRMETTVNENGSHSFALETTPVAELFAHGKHLRYNLPLGGRPEKRDLVMAIFGENAVEDGLIYWPSTSSYHVTPHSYNYEKNIDGIGSLEKIPTIGHGTTRKIDFGIGGLGNIGPGGAIISDDGSNGVINMVQALGNEDQANTIALNIEGAKYGQKSPLGTPSSTRDNMKVLSGFLSTKESEEKKFSEIHLHTIEGENLTNLVKRFDLYYRDLQLGALTDPAKAQKLAELNETLTGNSMEREDLISFLRDELKLNAEVAQKVVAVTRNEFGRPLPENVDFEIEAPADPYDGLDEADIQELKAKKQNELEGIVLNKLYDDKFVQEEMNQDVPEELEANADDSFEYEDDVLEQAEPAPEEAAPETLGHFLTESAGRLGTLSRKEQNKLVCKMIDAVNRNRGNIQAIVDPEKLDYKRIGKIPSINYQLRHSQRKLVEEAQKGQIVPLMSGTTELYNVLTANQEADDQAITKLRALYNVLNVPNLKKRTTEYQNMVGAIGRVSAKTKLMPEDKLYVINAVEKYASEKSVVPNSENGKLSLNYGYEAIKAVATSPEAEVTFLRPLEANITRLQTSMLRKHLITEDRLIRLPAEEQPEANLVAQPQAVQHIQVPGNN